MVILAYIRKSVLWHLNRVGLAELSHKMKDVVGVERTCEAPQT